MKNIRQHQTCEQCAEMCRVETKCCSFEWSPTQRPVMLIIMVLMMMMGVEFDTEVRNYVSDDVHDDDDNCCGDGVQNRGLYWKLQCNADDGWWLSPMLRLVIFFFKFFVGLISQRHTICIVRKKLILLLNAKYNILTSYHLAESAT